MKIKLLLLAKLLGAASSMLAFGCILFCLSAIYIWFLTDFAHQHVLILISLIICLINHYIAFRVKFDAALLLHLSDLFDTHPSTMAIEQITAQLDEGLFNLGLMKQAKVGREWPLRIQGCLRLFKIQIATLVVQCIFFIILIML